MNPEYYRLIEAGETLEQGDEYRHIGETSWFCTQASGVVLAEPNLKNKVYRRKLPAPSGWVSVKERLPERENWYRVYIPRCAFAEAYFKGEWTHGTAGMELWHNGEYNRKITHWMPIPENPTAPPKSDAELAWERWQETASHDDHNIKAAFIAGFNAEAAK